MTVRRKIVETAISLALIGAMIVTFLPLASYSKEGLLGTRINEENILGLYAEPENSLDMIYVGASACYRFWEALRAWENFGFTSYSFAVSNMTPQSIRYCIQEAQKTQNPKVWLIDLRTFQIGDEINERSHMVNMYDEMSIRNVTDHLKSWELRKGIIDTSVPNEEDRLEYYFPFLKHHVKVANNLIREVRRFQSGEIGFREIASFITGDHTNPFKGFHTTEKTKPFVFTDCSGVTQIKPLEGKLNEYFLDLLDYCKQEGITPLFVVSSYCQIEEHKEEYNYMKQVIESYGFDYLNTNDYYQEIGLDYSFDFYDVSHVNVFGAEKYTDFLAAYIDDRYDLPDHRSDPAFSGWYADAEDFSVMVEQAKAEILRYAEAKEAS